MRADTVVDRYFAAWNAHDGAAVAATFTPNGAVVEPLGGRLDGESITAWVERTCRAFPDLVFERGETIESASRRVVWWTMRGTNAGGLRDGIEPTDRVVTLEGLDVFDLDEDGIAHVRRWFDANALHERLGLMTLVQPVEQGKAKFGYAMRVPSGNPSVPGVIALTWIQGADELEKERIRAHARENVRDFLAEPGFIGIVTGFTGLRGFTVTAWEDEAAMKRALSKHHAVAMRELFSERFVASVWTSVWTQGRVNRLWVRCTSCGALEDVSIERAACSACGGTLPPRPEVW